MAKQILPWTYKYSDEETPRTNVETANRIKPILQVRLPNITVIFTKDTEIYTFRTSPSRVIKKLVRDFSARKSLTIPCLNRNETGNLIEFEELSYLNSQTFADF